MGKHPKTFSMRDLMLSVTCFAFVCLIVKVDFRIAWQNRWPNSNTANHLFVILSLPLVGAALGGGIGSLVGSFRKDALNGALLGLLFCMPIALWFWIPRVNT